MDRRRAREGRDEEERTGGEEAKHEIADDGDGDGEGIDGDNAGVFFCRIAVSRVSPYRPVSQVRSVGAPKHVGQRRELDILSACPHGVVP